MWWFCHRTSSLRSRLRADWITAEPVANVCQVRVAPAVLAIFAACSRGQPAPVEPAWTPVVAAPPAREVAIDLLPADLGDEAAVERMRHRVRVKRIGRAWLGLDATPINDGSGADDGDPSDEILPVIGETASRIRVVTE
jgi:hypothetical protein